MSVKIEPTWMLLRDVCACYALTYESAMNKVHAGTFPVPTFKVGKHWVVDKAVHAEYFAQHREAGLLALKSTSG